MLSFHLTLQARGKIAKTPRSMGSAPLALFGGWGSRGQAVPSQRKSLNHCVLEGKVNGQNGNIATVHPVCRPHRRLVFAARKNGQPARVDILPDGTVRQISGSNALGTISLSGINFNVYAGRPIRLARNWRKFGKVLRRPSFSKVLGHCVLGGVVHSLNAMGMGRSERVGVLPRSCRPERALIFNTIANGAPVRVDIQASGWIVLRGRPQTGRVQYLSLDGISFSTIPGVALRPGPTFANYDHSYRRATAHRVGPFCLVSGPLWLKRNLRKRSG